jgi:DUF4097 and DUF4098 domain-containing protein YvlB
MKKMMIALVGAFAFIAIGLICLMVVAVNRGGIWFTTNGFYDLKLVNEQTASLDGIDQIMIDYAADDVEFFTSDTNQLILKEYMSFTPDEDQLTLITLSGSKLKLKGRIRDDFNWLIHPTRGSRMEIYLPANYQGAIDASTSSGDIESSLVFALTKLRLSATSGNLTMNEVTAAQINLSTSSGDITVAKAEGNREFSATSGNIEVYGGAGDTSAATSSGDITIESSTGFLEAEASSGNIVIIDSNGEKELSTASGDIKIKDSVGYTKASASSGMIKADNLAGAGRFKTTSGDIRLEFADAPEKITDDLIVDASSGTAELTIPSTLQFNFNADTSSGTISTFFDDKLSFSDNEHHAEGSVGTAPNINLKIETTSGDIEVEQRQE